MASSQPSAGRPNCVRPPMSKKSRDGKGGGSRQAFDLYTWGHGGQGALGNSAFRDELEPYLVSSLRAYGGSILVDCGFDHTVVVTGDLRARAWGRAAEGQLGLESAEGVLESPRGGGCVLTPTLIGLCEGDAPAAIQAVACGGMHTVLMSMPRSSRDDPVVFTIGRGTEGQLGTGASGVIPSSSVASAVELPTELPVASVAAGGLHSAALSSHGHLFIWGDGGCGQLGLPPSPPKRTPPVSANTAQLLPSMAFEGRAELEKKVPVTVSAADVGGRSFTVLGRKHPPLQIANVSCGQYHTAACSISGEIFAWGANTDGQLGVDDNTHRFFPARVPLHHESGCVQVACGGRHTMALGSRGQVWSCGCNSHGQLGHGAQFGREPLWRFAEVSGLHTERVVLIGCGGAHAIAITTEGALYTWGKNHNGQLGLGHVQAAPAPSRIDALGYRVAWAACGGAHTACLVRLGEAGEAEQAASDVGMSTVRTARSAMSSSRLDATNRSAAQTTKRSDESMRSDLKP